MSRSGTRENGYRDLFSGYAAAVLMAMAVSAPAQETADTRAAAAATGVAEPAPSATNAPVNLNELRDPFWPVGYEPEPPATGEQAVNAAPGEPKSVIDWPRLQLAGLTRKRDGSYMALIRGLGWVSQGDPVVCRKKGITYRWVVEEIGEAGVRCSKQDATLPNGSVVAPGGGTEDPP